MIDFESTKATLPKRAQRFSTKESKNKDMFKIINCSEEHLTNLKNFYAAVYRPDYPLADKGFLKWQFQANPYFEGEGYAIKLALKDNQIIGHLGYIPVKLRAADKEYKAAWTANWMVVPEYQRLGVGIVLAHKLLSEFDVVMAVGVNELARNLWLRMGWMDFGYLKRYIKIISLEEVLMLIDKRENDNAIGGLFKPNLNHQIENSSATMIQRASDFDSSFDTFWQTFSGQNLISCLRESRYLNWRYVEHPKFQYHIFQSKVNMQIQGFAILRIEFVKQLDLKIGRLVEFAALPQVQHDLLKYIIDFSHETELTMLDFFCSSLEFEDIFTHFGFISGEEYPGNLLPLLFQPIDYEEKGIRFMACIGEKVAERKQFENIENWYVTKSDGDQDRPN